MSYVPAFRNHIISLYRFDLHLKIYSQKLCGKFLMVHLLRSAHKLRFNTYLAFEIVYIISYFDLHELISHIKTPLNWLLLFCFF